MLFFFGIGGGCHVQISYMCSSESRLGYYIASLGIFKDTSGYLTLIDATWKNRLNYKANIVFIL